ncbi:MAG TPA: hypothetical protein VNK49_09705 [Anaerolineales bacterium]|nr:hypothetical protein [Anaerolineales bacterium]
MSKSNSPTLEEWKRLYDLMAQVKALAPWEWMQEDDIFGIQMPETGEQDFVSVMGMLGEHFAVAVYQGIKGLGGFWNLQLLGYAAPPELVLQIPQVHASFEDRDMVEKADREVMKQLGLKFRGANAWPLFRSYRPGCFPWYIEKQEAKMLICALEQLLDVAPRFKDNPDMLTPGDDDEYLVRVKKDDHWEDSVQRITFRREVTLNLIMNEKALEHLRKMMPGKLTLEIDLYMMMDPVQEKANERPFFPFMLMLADHHSGMILGFDLLTPLPSMEAMWSEVPAVVVEKLAEGFPPKEVLVKDAMLYMLLQPVAEEAGFRLKKESHLKMIERAQNEFLGFMGGRRI